MHERHLIECVIVMAESSATTSGFVAEKDALPKKKVKEVVEALKLKQSEQ